MVKLNAFMVFSKENRQAVKDENPEASVTEVAKILGEKWRNLSEEEKSQYKSGKQKKSCGCK